MVVAQCPLCRQEQSKLTSLLPHRDGVQIDCSHCGSFLLFTLGREYFSQMSDRNLLPYLSAHTRQNSAPGNPFILDTQWEQYALAHKAIPVPHKLERLLSLIAQRTDPPGEQVSFSDDDPPLIDAANTSELIYLLKQLNESGYIELELTHDSCRCTLRASGWERIQEQTIAGIPGRCFVAMSFDPSLDDVWINGFYKALKEDCRLVPVRIDMVHHNEKICDKLIAEIRLSQFLVADFTLHRGGVYFEAGFALGLARPVIWTCREDELSKTHFDTRQYNHIVWKTPEELREKLRDRVLATIPRRS